MINVYDGIAETIIALLRVYKCDVDTPDLAKAVFKFLEGCNELEAKTDRSKE